MILKFGIYIYIERNLLVRTGNEYGQGDYVYMPIGNQASTAMYRNEDLDPATTIKAKAHAEAHEYGHMVRNLPNDGPLRELLRFCFFSELTPDIYNLIREKHPEAVNQPDEVLLGYVNDYLLSPQEIVERMSQLKNYFGIKNDSFFTKDHLDYAKQNYVADTGLDNDMTIFLALIHNERRFLTYINVLGI